MPISQHQTAENRKRSHVESEDELTESENHLRTRKYSITDAGSWKATLIEQIPKAIRNLLDTSESDMNQQRSRIGHLEAVIQQEKENHQRREKSQNERYAALEKAFTALKAKMASILMANIQDFSTKLSDETIIREWTQLGYNVRNIVSNYLTKPLQSGASADDVLHMRDSNARSDLWEIIYVCCFGGLAEYSDEEIGQTLARHISRIGR